MLDYRADDDDLRRTRRRSVDTVQLFDNTALSLSLPWLCLFLSSLSHTRPVVSSNGVLHFVIQYVGVRARRRHFGFTWRDGPQRPDTYVHACDASIPRLIAFFKRVYCRKKGVSFLACSRTTVCSCYYNHPFVHRLDCHYGEIHVLAVPLAQLFSLSLSSSPPF